MKIVVIGTGNTATVLSNRMFAAGHTISQIYSHSNSSQANGLAAAFGSEVIRHFSQLDQSADIILLAITDSALPEVAKNLPPANGILLHTAGSVSIDALENTSEKYGVLYPLQSLRKEKVNYEKLPLLVDGNTAPVLEAVENFASTISNQVMRADDTYRRKLHAAAVVVSNFTNHLYSLAADYCKHENVDFTLLQPLIAETAGRLQYFDAVDMQTGPAIRNDEVTITKHLELLKEYPQLHKLYELLTESIQQYKKAR